MTIRLSADSWALLVIERAACPSSGSPPWGLKTWVIGVVELRKVMEGALRALVHRTIKVVLVVTRRIGCFPGQVGGNATSTLHSGGSPKKWGQNQNWWGPQVGRNATSPLHSRGSPTKGTKSKWAHKWAEMLHHPCILGGPQ